MVCPWMTHGNILLYIKQNHGLERECIGKLLCEAAMGMEYLHGLKFLHGDIKGVSFHLSTLADVLI
jgi:serine/threonine protein kinase